MPDLWKCKRLGVKQVKEVKFFFFNLDWWFMLVGHLDHLESLFPNVWREGDKEEGKDTG